MEKSPDAFRTISEVSSWLETPAHVLRFWESRFPEIAPVKRAGGRRYYRPEDMRLLGGIKHLLHTEGQTIKAVQDRLARDGAEAVSALAPNPDIAPSSEPPAEMSDALAAADSGQPAPAAPDSETLPQPETDDEEAPRPASDPLIADADPLAAEDIPTAPATAPIEAPAPDRPAAQDAASDLAPPTDPDGGTDDAPDSGEQADAQVADLAADEPVVSVAPARDPTPTPADDAPSIGFFFDDSAVQPVSSEPLPPVPGGLVEAPGAAARQPSTRLPPLPDMPPDPDDTAWLPGPVLMLSAELRALEPGAYLRSDAGKAQLTALWQRLRDLQPASE